MIFTIIFGKAKYETHISALSTNKVTYNKTFVNQVFNFNKLMKKALKKADKKAKLTDLEKYQ